MEQTIILEDMDAWADFVADNRDALIDAYGSPGLAYRHAINGGLTLGGGAAPLFHVVFVAANRRVTVSFKNLYLGKRTTE